MRIFLVLACLMLPLAAEAAGLFLPARWARSQAMGGTGVALGDDLSNVTLNPAGLSAITTTTLMANYTAYFMRNRFQRVDPTGKQVFPETGNVDGFMNHIPNVFIGSNFGLDKFSLAGGLWTPTGPRHVYDPAGPQRYSMVFNQIQLAYVGLGAQYTPVSMFSFGATLQFANVLATQHIALEILPGASSLDGLVKVEGQALLLPQGVFGVTLRPTDNISIGLVYQTPINVELEGTIKAEADFLVGAGNLLGEDEVIVKQTIADELRLAIGYKTDKWSIEVGGRYYRWSIYKELQIDLVNNQIGDFAIEDITIAKQNRDAIAVNLGGSYALTKNHELRAGGFFDQAAIDPNSVTITEYDSNKFAVTGGYAFSWRDWRFSLAYMKIFHQEINASNSAARAISAFGEGARVGVGTYHWNVHNLSGSVEYEF